MTMASPPITEISFKNKHLRSKSYSECTSVDDEPFLPRQEEPTTKPLPPKKNEKRPPLPHKNKKLSKKPHRGVKSLRRNIMSRSVISSLTSWTGSRNSLMDDSTASELPNKSQDIFRSKTPLRNSTPKATFDTPKVEVRKQQVATPQRKHAAAVNDATPVRHNRAANTPNAPTTPPPAATASESSKTSPSIPLPASYSLSCNESLSTSNSASAMGNMTKRAVDNVLDNLLFEDDAEHYSVESPNSGEEVDSYYGDDMKDDRKETMPNLTLNEKEKRPNATSFNNGKAGSDYGRDKNSTSLEAENDTTKSTATNTDINRIFKKKVPLPPPVVETVFDDDSYFERDVEVSSLMEDAMSALEQKQGTAPDHWHFNVRSLRHKKEETNVTKAPAKDDVNEVPTLKREDDDAVNEDSMIEPDWDDIVDIKEELASYSDIMSLRSKDSTCAATPMDKSVTELDVPAESVCSSIATSKPVSMPDQCHEKSFNSNESKELVVAVESPHQNSSCWWQDGHDEETGTMAKASHKGGKSVKSIDPDEEPFTFRKTFMILFLIIGVSAITGGIAALVTSKHQPSQVGDEPAVQVASPPRITPPPSPQVTASPSTKSPTVLPTSQPVVETIAESTRPTTSPTTSAQTPATASRTIGATVSPTIDRLKLSLRENIELFSPESLPALDNATTPQARALNWTLRQPNPTLEQYSLATLYYSSTTKWSNDASWMTNSNVCDWYGILCREDKVTELTLSFNNLASTLPDELSLLTDLEVLSMAGAAGTGQFKGNLTGSIPSSWGERLVNLLALELYDNQLSGQLPATLQYLTDLEMLNVDGNKLWGPLPTELGALTSLEILDVSSNDFSGAIPKDIGLLTNLLSLKLSDNEITGYLPTHLGNIKSLKEFHAQDNVLMGSIPKVLFNLSKLTWLDLSGNELDGILPPSIGLLSNVEGLLLDDNRFAGPIPVELSSLTLLRVMKLSKNVLTGSVPDAVCKISSLSELAYSKDCGVCPCCSSCLNNTV